MGQQRRIPPSLSARFNQRTGIAFVLKVFALTKTRGQHAGEAHQPICVNPFGPVLTRHYRRTSRSVYRKRRAKVLAPSAAWEAGYELDLPTVSSERQTRTD